MNEFPSLAHNFELSVLLVLFLSYWNIPFIFFVNYVTLPFYSENQHLDGLEPLTFRLANQNLKLTFGVYTWSHVPNFLYYVHFTENWYLSVGHASFLKLLNMLVSVPKQFHTHVTTPPCSNQICTCPSWFRVKFCWKRYPLICRIWIVWYSISRNGWFDRIHVLINPCNWWRFTHETWNSNTIASAKRFDKSIAEICKNSLYNACKYWRKYVSFISDIVDLEIFGPRNY